MRALVLAALLAFTGAAGAQAEELAGLTLGFDHGSRDGIVHRWIERALGDLAGRLIELRIEHSSADPGGALAQNEQAAPPDDDADDDDSAADADDPASAGTGKDSDSRSVQVFDVRVRNDNVHVRTKDGHVVTVDVSPAARVPPVPPIPPVPPVPPIPSAAALDGSGPLISEHARAATTVELLHDIASSGAWQLTLVGVGKDKIDVDFDALTPIAALREVLLKSNCMGVLRGNKLAVMAATSGHSAGLLVEQRGETSPSRRSGQRAGDLVKVGGDLVVTSGSVVQGDAVAVLGSVEVEPGAVVQGSAASIGGSVLVHQGAVVLGDAVALGGDNDVERGGQVLGDHVQVGWGRLFSNAEPRHKSFLSRLGPFGLFPTLAFFAVIYLVGLFALRLWPERMRAMGGMLVGNPVRSFVIGLLAWILALPLLVLLIASVVGILLVPLLPLFAAVSVMLGACALALKIGEALPAGEGQRFVPPAALGMGLVAMLLASLLPWIGEPLLVLVAVLGPGAMIASRFGRAHPAT